MVTRSAVTVFRVRLFAACLDVGLPIRLGRFIERDCEEEDISRYYLRDLQDPFSRLDDEEFQCRYRFSKIAVHQLFYVISSDHELQ